jgi:hypothetical protein
MVLPTMLVNVRARPGVDGNILTVAAPEDALAVLGDKNQAQAKIGQPDQWLNVRTPQKYAGYVAAWLVRPADVPPPPAGPAPTELTLFAAADINMRAQPSANSPRVGGLPRGQALQVMETDLKAARDKVGKADQWIFGENKDGKRGWVAAWFLSLAPV